MSEIGKQDSKPKLDAVLSAYLTYRLDLQEKESVEPLQKKGTGASGDNIRASLCQDDKKSEKEVAVVTQWELPPTELFPEESFPEEESIPVEVTRICVRKDHAISSGLEIPTTVLMIEDSNAAKCIGEFIIGNPTDQYYGVKILCNKSALGVYKCSPTMAWIPPFQEISVLLEVDQMNYSSGYLTRKNKLKVRGHRLPKGCNPPADLTPLQKIKTIHPKVGELYELKPLLILESLNPEELLDTLEFSKELVDLEHLFAKLQRETLGPMRRFGSSLIRLSHHISFGQLRTHRFMKQINQDQFIASNTIVGCTLFGFVWYILAYLIFYFQVEPEIMIPEPEPTYIDRITNSFVSLFSISD